MSSHRKRKKPPDNTPIEKHRRIGKTLIAPLKRGPTPVTTIDWARDLLPDHLWIDSLAHYYGRAGTEWIALFDEMLDRIESRCPAGTCLLGILSDFARVPVELRRQITTEHRDFLDYAFTQCFGKIMGMYPDCPAAWLLPQGWREETRIDPEECLRLTESAILRLLPGKDDYCSTVRMMPLRRLMKHAMITYPKGDEMPQLLAKYPDGLTQAEKERVQSISRCEIHGFLLNRTFPKMPTYDWSAYFWRQNYRIAPCRYPKAVRVPPPPGEPAKGVETFFREFVETCNQNCEVLTKYLDEVGSKFHVDIYEPERSEVVLGLFARTVRLYQVFVRTEDLWAIDLSGIMLRCLADTTITLSFLAKRNDDELFRKFVEYGRGKEKLLMLHLQETYEGQMGPTGEDKDSLRNNLGGWFEPELISIDLGNWCKETTREMAKECGFEKEYRLVYDPASSDVHGTWVSIRSKNLVHCSNPLHRFHRLPAKSEPPLLMTPLVIATDIIDRCISSCVAHAGFPPMEAHLDNFAELFKRAPQS